jgi:tRNA-dependent cyclodipeptide synthase
MRGSKNEFPPQVGPYTVKVKNGAGWRDHDTARLQISVGQCSHEGGKLAATLNWVFHRFDHAIICVNDTLQRFNHQLDGLDPEAAFEKAKKDGDDWINHNTPLISALPSIEIHRWEHWKEQPDYPAVFKSVNQLMKSNAEFRDAITKDIHDRWNRKQRNGQLSDAYGFAEFSSQSEQYLLEETAVFSLMFEQTRAVDVYPGSVLLPCSVFQGREVDGAPPGLGKGAFTRIDFRWIGYPHAPPEVPGDHYNRLRYG